MDRKNKRILLLLAAALCMGAAGVGSILAYFSDQETAVNQFNFTGEDGLDGILKEPNWDPERGLLILPGETVPKDPQVTNTSAMDMDGMTALKVEFVYGNHCPEIEKIGQALSEEDMGYVYDVCHIDWNADILGDWVRFDGECADDQTQRFYYKSVLERNFPEDGDTTVPLFTELTVWKSVDNERYSHIQQMGGFDIRISGMIIQQMTEEEIHGLNSPKEAYERGLFTFSADQGGKI